MTYPEYLVRNVTIDECLSMYKMGYCVVISHGVVEGFEQKKEDAKD